MSSIREYLLATRSAIEKLDVASIDGMVSILFEAWKRQSQIFIMGNGGSASTASHMANDLSKATIVEGMPRMRVLALTDSISLITAWANDSSYACVFREQLANLLQKGDVVVGISASGNSPNILEAVQYARDNRATAVGWTGLSGGKLLRMADYCVQAPTDDVGMIESLHMVLDHLVAVELRARIRAQVGVRSMHSQ